MRGNLGERVCLESICRRRIRTVDIPDTCPCTIRAPSSIFIWSSRRKRSIPDKTTRLVMTSMGAEIMACTTAVQQRQFRATRGGWSFGRVNRSHGFAIDSIAVNGRQSWSRAQSANATVHKDRQFQRTQLDLHKNTAIQSLSTMKCGGIC